jgi:hypothetical protein
MNNELSLWQRIKNFFSNLFGRNKLLTDGTTNSEANEPNFGASNSFEAPKTDAFKKAEEDRKIIDLQRLFMSGKIKESDLTLEQYSALDKLFDSQIDEAKRKNNALKKKILKSLVEDKDIMQLYRQFQNGEVKEEDLTEDQTKQIDFLLDMDIERMKRQGQELRAKLA